MQITWKIAFLRFPAHRQIHQMAAMFSLADPPPRRPAAHPEETLRHSMSFSRTPYFKLL
jgi:hypothetical protein